MKHSIRQAKITIYLDVPTTDDKNHFIGNTEIVSLCEDAISKIPNFNVNAPSDIIVAAVESDDLEEMIFKSKENDDNVAGFLAPDGKWWLTYYAAIKSKKMQVKKVRLPKYKDKENGRNIFIYTNQCAKISNGVVSIKTKQGILSFKTVADKIQQVRLVPKGNHIVVEIIYNKECEAKKDNNRYASIDLGLDNLCTLTSNAAQSIIVNGKPLKSVNHHYNKTKAKLQSKLKQGKYSSKRISRLTLRRNRKIKDYMHKASRKIVEYMEANSLNTLFVGKNVGWKDSINLGRTNNQNFVSIPYNMLIQMLEYKCKLAGINVVIVNEAYTSKCSFLDKEKISKHSSYAGKRVRRGLFISSSGIMINADVNGSLNIMRLGLEKQNVTLDVVEEILRPENKRFVFNPIRICA